MKLRILCKQHNGSGDKRKANAVIQIFRILISWRQSEETRKNNMRVSMGKIPSF